jgi:hypothetical protein
LLRNRERAGIEVDDAPSQACQLASAHVGMQGEGPQCDEPIVYQRIEELAGFRRRPHALFGRGALRHAHRRHRVDEDEVPSHRVGQSAVQDAMRELDGVRGQRSAVLASRRQEHAMPSLHVEG